ncbi:hypothetical protein HMSSN036_01740 [Paenibacillus macerans]|nr:hypothetical protein HMSSN036_01740 [Paenibacillus macerans]
MKYWTDDRHDQEYIKELINKFNETNGDNIQVELTVMSENYTQSVDIAFSSNQAPDVLRLKSANTSEFVKKGYLAPLDDYLTDDMKTEFGSLLIDNVNRFDGKVYSLANTGLTMRLVYNKDLFAKAGIEKPPGSLQEMVDDAKKITEVGKSEGIYGFALNFKNPKQAFDRSIREILSLSGYQGLGFDPKTGQFDSRLTHRSSNISSRCIKTEAFCPARNRWISTRCAPNSRQAKSACIFPSRRSRACTRINSRRKSTGPAPWPQRWTDRSRELPKSCPPEPGSASAPDRPIRTQLGNSYSICTATRF